MGKGSWNDLSGFSSASWLFLAVLIVDVMTDRTEEGLFDELDDEEASVQEWETEGPLRLFMA